MVSCKQCQTPNSLDSTFCKRCGAAIAQSDLTEAQAKLEQLIEEGNALFNQGRTDEALAIAEAAVLANPSSTSGWSLKTLCHERRGEIAEALECADRLVELNPDSDFDKIRRSTLRQKLQSDLHVLAAPDRKLAVLGSISAIVLVLCIGAIVARVNSNNAATALKGNETATLTNQAPLQNTNPNIQPGTNQQVGNQSPPVSNQANPGNVQPPVNTDNGSDRNRFTPTERGNDLPKYTGPTLPDPSGYGNPEVVPVTPDLSALALNKGGGPAVLNTSNKAAAGSDQTDPGPIDNGTKASSTTPEEPKDQGTYQITVRSGGGGATKGVTSGSEPVGASGVDAMSRVGNQQYLMSNFAGAAKSYEQALQNGGDSIVLNKRLAQAYERLGRTSDAVAAYQRCMSSIDGALSSGHGDKDRLASTRGVCEQAIKVLQGG